MKIKETPITRALLRQHDACYTDKQLDALGLPDGVDLLTVLRRSDIPEADRIWVATLPGVVAPTVLWRWQELLVERALLRAGDPDPRSLAVVRLLRRLGDGEAVPRSERASARDAAWVAAWAAARVADGAAARASARAAARAAARVAAWAAEEGKQIDDLIALVSKESEC